MITKAPEMIFKESINRTFVSSDNLKVSPIEKKLAAYTLKSYKFKDGLQVASLKSFNHPPSHIGWTLDLIISQVDKL